MHVLRPMLLFMARLGITPNLLTLASLLSIIASGVILARDARIAGGIVFLFGSLLDAVDGELARVLKRDSPWGGLFDSLSDHCGDMAVSLGLLWSFLGARSFGAVVLVFMALFGSMLGSHVRSRAAMAGIETKNVGLFTRFERNLILIVGLFSGFLTAALWVLAVMNNVSAAQRIIHVARIPLTPEKFAR